VADTLVSIPVGSQPRIYSGEVAARFRLFNLGRTQIDARLGAGFDRIEYRSGNQTIPNDISVDVGPMLLAGLTVTF
jgi:hypothetical protein